MGKLSAKSPAKSRQCKHTFMDFASVKLEFYKASVNLLLLKHGKLVKKL